MNLEFAPSAYQLHIPSVYIPGTPCSIQFSYPIKAFPQIPDDFTTALPLVDLSLFDGIHVQPSDQFDSGVNAILIPTSNFVVASQSTNEEFNDSLESHSNDFNIFDFENRSPEPNTMEQDSLESIANSCAADTSGSTANASNAGEILVPIQSNENNQETNTIPEWNITKPIETECMHDSEEYDSKDIPGIESTSQPEKTKQIH